MTLKDDSVNIYIYMHEFKHCLKIFDTLKCSVDSKKTLKFISHYILKPPPLSTLQRIHVNADTYFCLDVTT